MRLKRNNVAIDIINFANPENVPKLTALVNAANNDNSHFVDVPLGVNQITNVLLESPIINGDQDMGAGAEVGNAGGNAGGSSTVPQQFQEYGGIDPNIDPELAMAMRISMEEERAKQQEAKPEENKPKENENQD
jgi:26S proteasome regulatory subunit N10